MSASDRSRKGRSRRIWRFGFGDLGCFGFGRGCSADRNSMIWAEMSARGRSRRGTSRLMVRLDRGSSELWVGERMLALIKDMILVLRALRLVAALLALGFTSAQWTWRVGVTAPLLVLGASLSPQGLSALLDRCNWILVFFHTLELLPRCPMT